MIYRTYQFTGTSLFDVEYLTETIRDRHMITTEIESDIWPIELCHRQWPRSTFKVICAIFLWK